MGSNTIVIIGGALAGPTAAARAREVDEHAKIILIERGPRVSYALCGLSYHLSGEVADIGALDQERAEFFDSVYGVDVWTGAEVTKIDTNVQQLTVHRHGSDEVVAYDALVVALGAESVIPETPGFEGAQNLTRLRTLDDLAAVRTALVGGCRRFAIIGGGPMGVEAADGLLRAGAAVSIIEQGTRLLSRFGEQVCGAVRRELQSQAVVMLDTTVARATQNEHRINLLELSNGQTIETDFVVVTAGLAPRTALLEKTNVKLAANRTIVVDSAGKTSVDRVFACGVCVSVPQVFSGDAVWWPQGALADKTAQVAGANAAGGAAELTPALGTTMIRALGLSVGRTGLSFAEAQKAAGETNVATTTVHAPSHEGYFPGSAPVLVELIWDRRDGRLLGAEAVGTVGVDKRIDAAAVAIAGGLTLDELAQIDFGYAPPFGALRDPLNVAATVADADRKDITKGMTPSELKSRLDEVGVVDVRGDDALPSPFPGAIRMPITILRRRLDHLDKGKPIVVVSGHGKRASQAARILRQRGFSDVSYLAGGIASWNLVQP